MAEEAEEKQLPASEKKLRDARRKGQVSSSRDLISGFTLFAALLYLYFSWPSLSRRLFKLVQTVATPDPSGFREIAERAAHHFAGVLFLFTVPLAAVIAAVTLLFGMIATQGPVFSTEPIKPRFENVNPVKGLKKIFSLRNVVEFTKGLAKVVALGAVFAVILMAWMQPLFDTPACGSTCIQPVLVAALKPLGIAAVLAFVVIGVIDVPLQRWLFRRDMRMTKTEFKREHKDIEGDPLIRQELRRLRRDIVTTAVKPGLANATLVFFGGDRVVALRYLKDETPVPAVVAKGQGALAATLLTDARRQGLLTVEASDAVEALFDGSRVGDYIRTESFPAVVKYLVRLKLV
jgi:type III secretion protein U